MERQRRALHPCTAAGLFCISGVPPSRSKATGDDNASPSTNKQTDLWDMLKENRLTCFVLKGDHPSWLRVAEVMKLAPDKRSGEFWYWIHDAAGRYRPDAQSLGFGMRT